MESLYTLLGKGEQILNTNEIIDAKIDAWLLLEYVFQLSKSEYLVNRNSEADSQLAKEFLRLAGIRATHKPLQHIIGIQEFMGLPFQVNEHVLIPRQDTEILVEKTIALVKSLNCQEEIALLDMCTGSGCIAISIAKYLKVKKIVGVDISKNALELAEINALKNVVDVEFVESDLFSNINEKFSIIVSNPPYIKSQLINELMVEVKDYEPVQALDGGLDGIDFYRAIIEQAKNNFTKNGYLLLEIGYDQAESVMELLRHNGYYNSSVVKDLSGLDRVVMAEYRSTE